jgi:ribonuclease R
VCHRALLSAVGGGERAPRARELAELGAWTSDCERAAMTIERDADDVARCFALEQLLYETGWEQIFSGEVVGLISAGAFIAFGGPVAGGGGDEAVPAQADGTHVFEGMLPVRRMRIAQQPQSARAGVGGEVANAERGGEWWELNDLGTILHGQRTGATLRLGEQVEVSVARVDAPRGRVDLVPAAAGSED